MSFKCTKQNRVIHKPTFKGISLNEVYFYYLSLIKYMTLYM